MRAKRCLSLLLTLTLIVGLFAGTFTTAFADGGAWNGTVATGFDGGSGTEGDPYQIADGEQLAYLATLVNGTKNSSTGKYYVLTADIDLNDQAWTPIGTSSTYRFEGVFNGSGYSVTGLSIDSSKSYQGLFGYISSARISNLTVDGEINISGSAQYTGGITGYAAVSTIENCESRVNISTYGYDAGGIAGYAGAASGKYSPPGCEIINCANTGDISSKGTQTQSSYALGGITGTSFYTRISGCYNTGTLSGAALTKGGITGKAAGNGCVIENCYNLGKMEITEETTSKYAAVGGIVGYLQNYYPQIENCYNAGELVRPPVNTTSGGEDVTHDLRGGIIGFVDIKTAADESKITLTNNYYMPGEGDEYKGYCSYAKVATDTEGTTSISSAELTVETMIDRLNNEAYTHIDGINGGYPALKWQDPDALYSVSFSVTLDDKANDDGNGYTLVVTDDSGDELEADEDGVYTLGNGAYNYEISQKGYETAKNPFNVNKASAVMSVILKAIHYEYTLSVSPADAAVVFSSGGAEIDPESAEDGEYVFALTNGSYSYSISAFGYEPQEGDVEIAYAGDGDEIELVELAGYNLTAEIAAAEGDFLPGTPVLTIYQDDIPVRTIKGETSISTKLPEGKYTYLIKAKGFASQEGSFEIDGEGCDLGDITMPVRLSWDGEGIDTDWYDADTATFTISTADELAGLAAIVNGTAEGISKDNFSGKTILLMKDIDLGDEQWTPIGIKSSSNTFGGVFNGQGFTISGLCIDISIASSTAGIGLFGYTSGTKANNAVIQNLNVEGEIRGTTAYSGTLNVGGIIGNANGGYSLIEQCCSDVNIDVEQSGGAYAHTYAGGIAGQCLGTLRSCGNRGSIKVTSSATSAARPSVGGVAGSAGSGSSTTMYTTENLYNWGTVTLVSSHYGAAGGVLGTSSSYNTIQNVYNAGRVKASFAKDSTSDNAVGAVCGFLGASPTASKVTLSNAWYLEDTAETGVGNARKNTNWAADAKTSDEMKDPAFVETLGGDNFKLNPNGGYPILAWERMEKTYAVITFYDGDELVKTESALIGGSYALPRLQDKSDAIFAGWKAEPDSEDILTAGTVIEDMEGDCSFYAAWRAPVSYGISVAEGTDAIWTVDAPESANERSQVTVTVERDAGTPGVVLTGITVQGPDGLIDTDGKLELDTLGGACKGTFTFTMPSGEVTLSIQAEYSSLSIGYKNAPDAEGETEARRYSALQTDVDARDVAWSAFDGETFTTGTATGIKLTTAYLARFGAGFVSGDTLVVTDMNGTEHTFTYDELYETRYSFASADAEEGTRFVPMIALVAGEGDEAASSRGVYRFIVGQKSADDDNSKYMISSVSAITVVQRENVVKFVLSPEDATLKVTAGGVEVEPQDDGSYLFPRNSSFTYTVSATRYDTETKTVKVTGDMTITVTLGGFDENRPFTDDEGYLLIGTAENLKWWNGHARTEDKVKLTADIWLNEKDADGSYDYEYEWPFITYVDSESHLTNAFRGTFDGQGHTVYGLYINRENTYELELSPLGGVMAFSDRETYVGFFARSGGDAVIKDLGVEGKIELIDRPDQLYADYTQVGGLVGMAEGSTSISGCWTNVAIQAKASGDTGSLGGYPYAGYPYVDDMYVGGIAGSVSGSAVITDSYTQGSLIGAGMRTVHIGGIAGATRYQNQIKNCYSTASIESYPSDVTISTSYLGGIIGTSRSYRSDNQTTYSDATIDSCVALNSGITGTEGFTKYNTIGGDDYNSKRYSNNYAAEIPVQGAELNGTRNAGEAFTDETFSTIGWSEYSEESGEGMWHISGRERPLLWWQSSYAQDLTDTYEPAPDTNSSWDGQFGEGTPPPTFTLSVQVNGYGAIEYKTYKAAELLKQANANYREDGMQYYSSWSTSSSAGRVVRQYVYLDELLDDAGIVFTGAVENVKQNDSLKMGGWMYSYEYLMADRYFYPGWTSGSIEGAQKVRPIIALRSYKAANPGAMEVYAGSCDYLWAYALNYGQADVYESTYPYFVYQQIGATVMYEKEDPANSTMRDVLADVIEKAREAKKDVTAAQLVYYDRDATNEDVMEAIDALNGQSSKEEEISPSKLKKDFSVYVTVGRDSVLLNTFSADAMYTMAVKDSPLLYSSRTDSGYSSGRAVAEYVRLDELLSSAGAVWRSGDILKMGGNVYSYDSLMADRYYYYGSEPVSVPAVIALKSYGGKTSSNSTLSSWLSSADYLYAYMLTYGQKDKSDSTYSSFVYKQSALSVVYEENEPANPTLRLLLEETIEEGEAAGKDVSKAKEVLDNNGSTNRDAIKAILAVYPDKSENVPVVDNDDDDSSGSGSGSSQTGAAKELTVSYDGKTEKLSVDDMEALSGGGRVYFSAVTGKGDQVGYTNSYVTLSDLLDHLGIESFETVKFTCTDGSTGTYTWEELSKTRYDFSSGEAEEIEPMLAILSYMEYGSDRSVLKGLVADSYARFRFIPGQTRRSDSSEVLKWVESVAFTGAVMKSENKLPYTDVSEEDWFAEAVAYAYENGLMTGTSDDTFSPNMPVTRGMIVTILYRLEGEPNAAAADFTDVSAEQWYGPAVAWAAANGIVTGYGDGRFGPNDSISREQFAAILCRYAGYKGYDVTARTELSSFRDAGDISAWALDSMSWAAAEGLISGVGDARLEPYGSATRAQAAVILYRFCSNIVK